MFDLDFAPVKRKLRGSTFQKKKIILNVWPIMTFLVNYKKEENVKNKDKGKSLPHFWIFGIKCATILLYD